MEKAAHPILDFYRGRGRDAAGRTIAQVLAMDDAALEREHDFIQWIFPLLEPSSAVPGSPTLSETELDAMRSDPGTIARARAACARMLAFYGLVGRQLDDGEWAVDRSPNYAERSGEWLRRPHNFLRITRILKSLLLFGLEAEARACLEALRAIYVEHAHEISAHTFDFWRRAVDE